LDEAASQIKAGRSHEALEPLNQALGTEERPQALFFQAVALNRLDRPAAALDRLDQAAQAGFKHPERDFERGWALLALGRFRDAEASLLAFIKEVPERGQAHELLGRALAGQKRHAEAQAALAKALELDPQLRPSIRLMESQLSRAQGHDGQADCRLRDLLLQDGGSPVARVLRAEALQLAPQLGADSASPWRFRVDAGASHSTNVISLGADQPLPGDISSSSDTGFHASAAAQGAWTLANCHVLSVELRGLAQQWLTLRPADFLDAAFNLGYALPLGRGSLRLGLGDQYSTLGGQGFRNLVQAQAAYQRHFNHRWSGLFAYRAGLADFLQAAPAPSLDRDANNHSLSAGATYRGDGWQAGGHYALVLNNAAGSDFRSTGHHLGLQGSRSLPWRLTLSGAYQLAMQGYPDATAFARSRNDLHQSLQAALERPFFGPYRGRLSWSTASSGSSVSVYNFTQHTASAGVSADF
jgi:tetratricopeptide (TPR) repeat protein